MLEVIDTGSLAMMIATSDSEREAADRLLNEVLLAVREVSENTGGIYPIKAVEMSVGVLSLLKGGA